MILSQTHLYGTEAELEVCDSSFKLLNYVEQKCLIP